ncbi:MAG: ATP-dependent helicase, partial [Salibacteraceae bacterium]|nr:ATP-dependent helicase [Salibacteraceae bacterium]
LDKPEEVNFTTELIPEEQNKPKELTAGGGMRSLTDGGGAFHKKSAKNSKENLGSRYKREIKTKFKKPLTRGDKNQNKKR